MDGAYFWKIWKIRKENQREPVPEVVTRQGARLPPGCAPYPREPTVRRSMLLFCRKKANIRGEITTKVSGQSELRISIYIYKTVKQSQKRTQNQRETER